MPVNKNGGHKFKARRANQAYLKNNFIICAMLLFQGKYFDCALGA
jgi:hypothetical protein